MPGEIARPDTSEYDDFYGTYIDAVPDGDILTTLDRQLTDATDLLGSIDDTRGGHRYAPGKWSIKEIIGHVVDAERVFAHRALCFARLDPAPQPGFDHDAFVAAGGFDARPLEQLTEEFALVRRANLHFFRGLDTAATLRRGVANGVEFSVRSLAFIIAGHERHHMGMLRERYL